MVHYKHFAGAAPPSPAPCFWSSKFYPYVRVGLRDKVMAAPRLNVAGLSLYSTHLFPIMFNSFYDLPLFHLSGFCVRLGESGYIFSGFGETKCSYLQNITDTSRTFRFFVVVLLLFVHVWKFYTRSLDDFPKKKQARSIVFCPSSDQQIPREKMDCFLLRSIKDTVAVAKTSDSW